MAGAVVADGQEGVIAAAQHVDKNDATSNNETARLDAAEAHPDPVERLRESSYDDAAEYLSAVDEVILLAAVAGGDDDLLRRAKSVVQFAMARLEVEFQHLINQNSLHLDADNLQSSFSPFPSDSGYTTSDDSDHP
ncbi:putative exocyst complex component EXO70B1-like [Cocos nucifera]|uniref:Putative exocyst complex component EXO70B1-like n=1 Tax=Cocos nucifera TaxID=13894 RepID=A0A8K0HYQ4_COCNU|nr:putative exocyst complex component EXO70B1-like [Cocos nucifera]